MKPNLNFLLKFCIIILFLSSEISFAQEDINVPFAVLEDIPMFPNCIDVERSEGRNCFMQEMNNHIKLNFRYPKKAKKNKIQGRVTVMFLINYEGYVEITKIVAQEGTELLAEEAERIIKLLPKFKPGMFKGEPVDVMYAQPIVFKIN